LHWAHNDCAAAHERSLKSIPSFLSQALTSGVSPNQLNAGVKEAAKIGYVSPQELTSTLATSFGNLVNEALADKFLPAEEEHRILELWNGLGLSDRDFDQYRLKLTKAAILRDLSEGRVPNRIQIDGLLQPFNLGNNESLLFKNARYYEPKTRTRYVGGSSGVSIRVVKGVSFRVGNYRGERIQNTEMTDAGSGLLAITNINLYFAGGAASLRVKLKKIASVDLYTDGIRIWRDVQNAKPQVFLVDDPQFAAALISFASKL